MKPLVILVLLVAVCLVGCGLVHTPQERHRRYRTITKLNARMIVDDWDYFWLADRPSHLTYWYLRGAE